MNVVLIILGVIAILAASAENAHLAQLNTSPADAVQEREEASR